MCRFVTQDELSSLSSYMRGRLTLDKVANLPANLAFCLTLQLTTLEWQRTTMLAAKQ